MRRWLRIALSNAIWQANMSSSQRPRYGTPAAVVPSTARWLDDNQSVRALTLRNMFTEPCVVVKQYTSCRSSQRSWRAAIGPRSCTANCTGVAACSDTVQRLKRVKPHFRTTSEQARSDLKYFIPEIIATLINMNVTQRVMPLARTAGNPSSGDMCGVQLPIFAPPFQYSDRLPGPLVTFRGLYSQIVCIHSKYNLICGFMCRLGPLRVVKLFREVIRESRLPLPALLSQHNWSS